MEVTIIGALRDEIARLTTERDAAIARAERAERVAVKTLRKLTCIGEHPKFIPWGNYWVPVKNGDVYSALVEACEGETNV